MSNQLISIIIPAYNHEEYVYSTIKSLAEQSYDNLELVIVNDGSTDKTDEVIKQAIKEFEGSFSAINYISRENRGLCATLNQLIDSANGEYIYYTASDDMVKPSAIEEQYQVLQADSNCALVVTDADIIDENSNVVFWDTNLNNIRDESKATYKTFAKYLRAKRSEVDFLGDDFASYESLLRGNYIPNSLLFRKSALLEVGKYDSSVAIEDWYINLQLSKKYKIKYLDKPLFLYRWHSNNSIKNNKKMSFHALNIISKERKYCFNNGMKYLWSKEFAKRFLAMRLYVVIDFMKNHSLLINIVNLLRKI